MKHIRQQNHLDCGIAVAASLAQCSYDQVAALYRRPITRGLWLSEIKSLVARLTGTQWQWRRVAAIAIPQFLPASGIVLIRYPKKRGSHYIACQQDTIYDPEMPDAIDKYSYERQTCVVHYHLATT